MDLYTEEDKYYDECYQDLKDVRERLGNPLGADFQPSSLSMCVKVKMQRKEQEEQLAISRANKCIDEPIPCLVAPCPTHRVCYDGKGMPKHPLGENLTKEEQICRTKANSMFTCPPESSSCLGLGRQREEWANNCVRNATTPKRYSKLETSHKELKKALPWIIGAGVIILIIYKNK